MDCNSSSASTDILTAMSLLLNFSVPTNVDTPAGGVHIHDTVESTCTVESASAQERKSFCWLCRRRSPLLWFTISNYHSELWIWGPVSTIEVDNQRNGQPGRRCTSRLANMTICQPR